MDKNSSAHSNDYKQWNAEKALHILYSNALPSLTGSLGVFLVLAVSLSFQPVYYPALVIWTVTGIGIALVRLSLWWRYSRGQSNRELSYWLGGYRLATLASGVVNGCCVWFFFLDVSPAHQMLILFAISGLTAAATGTHAIDTVTFNSFLYAACVPTIIKLLLIGDATYFALAVMLVFYIMVMKRTGKMNRETLETNLQLTYKMQYRATHDPLVDLLNREEFENQFELRRETSRHGAAILFIDLDNFKQLNDEIGHAAGDEALVEVAAIIKRSVRHDDIAARLGGDEFVVLLMLDDVAEAERIANTIVSEIDAMVFDEESSYTGLGASVGIAFQPKENSDFSNLMNAADTACYESKRQGKNQVTLCPLVE